VNVKRKVQGTRPSRERFVRGVDDLLTVFPGIAEELHPLKNEGLNADDFSAGSHDFAWWLCSSGHEWRAKVEARTRSARPTGCPYCAGKKVISGINDLETVSPELANEFSSRNLKRANEINPTSKTKFIWVCLREHEWEATPKSRANGSGCPICRGKLIVKGENDFFSQFLKLKELWDFESNAQDPQTIHSGSRESFHWRCENGHKWKARAYTMARRQNCKSCANNGERITAKLVGLDYPFLQREWNISKNSDLSLSLLKLSDPTRYWWTCERNHEWQASISNRTRGKNGGTGCPVCANRVIVIGYNDLATTHPQLAHEWDFEKNQPKSPQTIVAGSPKPYWWICDKGHSWEVAPRFRVRKNSINGCPYCGNQKVLKGFNDFETLWPDLIAEWDELLNLPTRSDEVMPGSKDSFWWNCPEGHSYPMRLSGRVAGNSCTVCHNSRIIPGINDLATINPELAGQWDKVRNFPITPHEIPTGSSKKYWWICANGHSWRTSVAHRSNDRNCPGCVKKGYNQTIAGSFYFIEHKGKRARKFGITNVAARQNRVTAWQDRGWIVHSVVSSDNGTSIALLETLVERWVRDDLQLPRYLESKDMDGMGGWSETFSGDDDPSNEEVIGKIDELWKIVQDSFTS
jgi:hypothetical protein